MTIKPIRNSAEHLAAKETLKSWIVANKEGAKSDDIAVLVAVIEQFERKIFPIDAPSPVTAIKHRMDQRGMSPRDLEPFLGSRARVSEILCRSGNFDFASRPQLEILMAAKTDMNCYEAGKRPLPPHVERMPASTMDTRKSRLPNPAPNLMRFRECAQDGGVCVKTIARWVERGLLTEWRPHPKSRTRRIKRAVWEAFKHRAL